MLNSVVLMGRLTADPDYRTTPSGIPVAAFRLAVERGSDNRQQADFIDIVAWHQNADFSSRYFHKMQMVVVQGSLQSRNYEDKKGNKRITFEVIADKLYFADYAPTSINDSYICKRCKRELKADQHISGSSTFCLFCRTSSFEENDGIFKTFDNSKDALMFIAKQHGSATLLGKQLRSFFSDYAPQVSANIKNLVFAVYDKGASSILQNNHNAMKAEKEIAFKQAVEKLTDAFIAQEAANNIIREFTLALGWD